MASRPCGRRGWCTGTSSPANILLDLAGNAYITDFGLAKDSEGSVLTRPGQALGSMDYMPPEQIRGEPVTGAADTYSLGCVVFECLYGRPPFGDRQGMRCCGPTSRRSRRTFRPDGESRPSSPER